MNPKAHYPSCESHSKSHVHSHHRILEGNERRTLLVFFLTLFTMFVEVGLGYWSGSLSLLADGWHMVGHASAMGVSILAYRLSRSESFHSSLTFGAGKIIPLGGYTNAVLLGLVGILMCIESAKRFQSPEEIRAEVALYVAIFGFLINFVSIFLLRNPHSHSHEEDPNLKSVYVHIIADAFTSLLAILALLATWKWHWTWVDPFVGLLGGVMILRWSYSLIKETGGELLDRHAESVTSDDVRKAIETPGVQVLDVHVWRLGPGRLACELVVSSDQSRGADYYRNILCPRFALDHIVVEERVF